MKIKYADVLKLLIEILIIMKLGYIKLLGSLFPIFDSQYETYASNIFYLVIIIICLLYTIFVVRKKPCKFLNIEFTVILITIFGGIINAISCNNLNMLEAISSAMPFFYFFLAYPISILLKNRYWSLTSLFNFILIWGTGAYLFKTINCATFYFTGSVVWSNLIDNDLWILNSSLRINPPCMGLIMLPIAIYMYRNARKNKTLYLISIILIISYSVLVHQSRSVLIYQVMTILIMFLFEKVTSKKKLIRYAIVLLGILIFVNTQYFENLFNSFSVSNTTYGNSTFARLSAIYLFAEKYLEHVFWGTGFLSADSKYVGTVGFGQGHLDDIGLLGTFFTLGIPFLMLIIVIFSREIFISKKIKKFNPNESLLLLGMTSLIMTTCINISCFNEVYAFAMPFYVGVGEYLSQDCC